MIEATPPIIIIIIIDDATGRLILGRLLLAREGITGLLPRAKRNAPSMRFRAVHRPRMRPNRTPLHVFCAFLRSQVGTFDVNHSLTCSYYDDDYYYYYYNDYYFI